MTSTIAFDNAKPSAGGTEYSVSGGVAKFWYDYNQTGDSVDGSLNVTSVTDVGTGILSYTLTNAFSDGNWSSSVTGGDSTTNNAAYTHSSGGNKNKATDGWGCVIRNTGATATDYDANNGQGWGTLA